MFYLVLGARRGGKCIEMNECGKLLMSAALMLTLDKGRQKEGGFKRAQGDKNRKDLKRNCYKERNLLNDCYRGTRISHTTQIQTIFSLVFPLFVELLDMLLDRVVNLFKSFLFCSEAGLGGVSLTIKD